MLIPNKSTGITLTPASLNEFMTSLTASPHSHAIDFAEFRNFLLLLPRKISTAEIYRYYQVRKFMGDDGKGAARVTMEGEYYNHKTMSKSNTLFPLGDVSLSAEDKPPFAPVRSMPSASQQTPIPVDQTSPHAEEDDGFDDYDDEDEEPHGWLEGHAALKFLAAGGIAGAGTSSGEAVGPL